MNRESAWISVKVYALRAKNLLLTAVQLLGFAVVLYGCYAMFNWFVDTSAVDGPLPTALVEFAYAASIFESVVIMAIGGAIVWVTTAQIRTI